MGKGRLILHVVAADGAVLIGNARVTITNETGMTLFELRTNNTGHTTEVSLDAPDIALTEDPYAKTRRYSLYNAQVRAQGYKTAIYRGIMVFDQSTSIQTITMHPLLEGETEDTEVVVINYHALDEPVMPEPEYEPEALDRRVLREVVIPNYITVHLGRPERAAQNVRVPFIDYIKV